jgi:hypothetical protein
MLVGTKFTEGYTIYNEKYFSERQFSYTVRVLTWRAWRRVQLPVAIAEPRAKREVRYVLCYA